jgi:hypothetical protein
MKKFTILLLLMTLLVSAGAFAQNDNPGRIKATPENDYKQTKMLLSNDVGVYCFLSPTSGPYLGDDEIVTISVKNFGTTAQSNIPVSYTLDGGTPVMGIVPGPIIPGETADFTFGGTVDLSNPGQSFTFISYTALEGDDNPANDCKTMMIVGWPTYCDASTTIQREYITQVNFGNISNSSDWQGGVADYTALSTSIEAGGSQFIYVSNPVPNSGDVVFVWVDWNMDYTFDISGNEQYVLFYDGGTGSDFFGYITVPLGTPTGDYRMRIRLSCDTRPMPCGNADYGEIEDYTLNVDTFPPPSNLQATLTGNDVFLTWDSPPKSSNSGLLGYEIIRSYNLIGFVEFTNYNDNDVAPGTYNYYVTAVYDNGYSVWAGPVTIIIPGPVISVNPYSVTQNIPIGEVAESTLEIANTGTVGLTYTIEVEYLNPIPTQPETSDAGKAATVLADRMAADGISDDLVSLSNCNPGGASSNQKENEFIRYDDGKNFKAIGLTTGGTFGISTYYPAATLARYEGWSLSQLGFYINQVPEICKIKVYGKGTPTSPGELLYEEIVNPTGFSWNIFTLGDAVLITGEDLWLGLELTHQAGTNPAGCDNGPAIAGFGDMISFNNVTWAPLSNCGLSYNWNIVGYLVDESPMATNDVGVQTHLSPTDGINLGEEVVTITVKNYGTAAQSNIPVFYYMGGGDTITGTITGTLASGETTDYTFDGTVNLGNVGITYAFHTGTSLAGDENATNDCHYFTVTNIYPWYCPASTSTEDEYIANVLFGDINNSSGWQNSVADFTAIFTTIHAGISENITVTNGNAWASDIVSVWVDWNQDYTFGSGEEFFMLTNVGGTGAVFTGNIMAPAGQANGNYRMRIRMTYSTPPQPCWNATYGEIEDYTIKVDGDLPGWLNVPNTFGTVAPEDTTTVSLHFDAVGLAEGIYDANLIIANNSDNYPVLNVPVKLIVGECPLPPPLNIVGYEILPNVAYLSWQVPEPSGNLLGYNIYRNNQKINPDIVPNLFYEDSLTNPSQYFYHITAVYTECEASSDTISLVITNLPEKENDGITIFPNPATNSVNIKSQYSINQISILNNIGQVVFSGNFDSNSVQVNTSGFDKGIYMIQVKTMEGSLVKKLVIK